MVYGGGDPKVPKLGRERTCYFHWSQSLEKHTKQYIKHNLQDQYMDLCVEYHNAISMDEAETQYLAIRAWWSSLGATSKTRLKHLELWLAFWHFCYRQWGGFVELVSTSHFPFFLFILILSLKHVD